MLTAAAIVPTPPLLVPEIAGGSAEQDAPLRAAARAAVRHALRARPGRVVVVGTAPETRRYSGAWDWSGFGLLSPTSGGATEPRLPHPLAIGAWLLQETQTGTVSYQGVADTTPPEECAALGRALAADGDVALIVCGDGSACRDEAAPGHLDPDAEGWDEQALAALRNGSPDGLLALDPVLARRVLAQGRAPWQVLAGAARDARFDAGITWSGAPYGVLYAVGTWTRTAPDSNLPAQGASGRAR